MADLEAAIKTHLKAFPVITDSIGSGTAARIYSNLAKQGVQLPYIVFEVFSGRSYEHINGVSGMAMNRVQIDCFGATKSAAFNLAELVRGNMQMWRGDVGGIFVNNITSDGGYERGFDKATTGGNQRRYWISRDFLITYTIENPYIQGVYGDAFADQYG